MKSFIVTLLILGGGAIGLFNLPLHAQSVDTTVVAILCVQFADKDTNYDARGSVGLLPPDGLDTLENKYRFKDYWNIIFQASGPVVHPDSDFRDLYARGGHGFDQYGSLRRYMEDNSFGLHTVVPYQSWSAGSGLLNTLTADTSGNPDRAIVNWLTLDTLKTSSFVNAHDIAKLAIAEAQDSLSVAWDSLDIVLVYFAGILQFDAARQGTYSRSGFQTVPYAISSERYKTRGVTTFAYPRVMWHEFLHQIIDADDLHSRGWAPDVSGVGHYAMMGDNSPLASYTPEMLDPWHRLRRGWLKYVVPKSHIDSLTIHTSIDTTNFHLPVVEERTNGEIPTVLVIPEKLHPEISADSVNWKQNGQHFFIVENRRAIGWDSVIVKYEMEEDSTHGVASGVGGFIVWSVWRDPGSSQSSPYVWIHDADGDFDTWKAKDLYGEPTDLFTGASGQNIFSTWSASCVFDKAKEIDGSVSLDKSRNVYLEFAPYVDSSNVNPISRMVIDRFVPAEHGYADSEHDDSSATKYSTQSKIAMDGDVTASMFTTNGKTFLISGESLDEQRHVAWVNHLIDSVEANIENSALTRNHDTLKFVWQQKYQDGYDVVVRCATDTLIDLLGTTSWGRYTLPPRPVIASSDSFTVIAFAADSGIAVSTSTMDRSWSDLRLLTGSGVGSKTPFVLLDTASVADTSYIVVFESSGDEVALFRSRLGSTTVLSKREHEQCSDPTAARLGSAMSVVYQFYDVDADRNYVGRVALDLSNGSVPNDYDAFGLEKQKSTDENRDPVFLYTDSTDAERSVLYWVFNKGEKLLFATQPSGSDAGGDIPYAGVESSLSSKTTSYPHLLYHEAGNPKVVVSRSGTFSSGMGARDNTPSLIVLSKDEDLAANPNLLELRTELGMHFSDATGQLMHVHWGTPFVVQGADTTECILYDYQASKDFTTEPVDTLSKTMVFQLTNQDAAVFSLDISCDEAASDTLVIESFLIDPTDGTVISSSGEYKYPPIIGDTSLTIGLELPNGYPLTDCILSTSLSRGYWTGGTVPDISLGRYMLFSEYSFAKRATRDRAVVPQEHGLQIYPQPAQEALRFILNSSEDATVMLYDLLGRCLRETRVHSNGQGGQGMLRLDEVSPGVYLLVARTKTDAYTRKVVIAR